MTADAPVLLDASPGNETAAEAPAGEVGTGNRPPGSPQPLTLDVVQPFDPGRHCGDHRQYFGPTYIGVYSVSLSTGGAVQAMSDAKNIVQHAKYCQFTLPAGTRSLVVRRGRANITHDPAMMYPGAGGGGLGFMVYFGASSPADSTGWGNYGMTSFTRWFSTRADWNHDLAAEEYRVPVPAGTTTATVNVEFADAWTASPISAVVDSLAVVASAVGATDAGATDTAADTAADNAATD